MVARRGGCGCGCGCEWCVLSVVCTVDDSMRARRAWRGGRRSCSTGCSARGDAPQWRFQPCPCPCRGRGRGNCLAVNGACELSTTADALAGVRRRLSLALGERGRQILQTRPLGEWQGAARRRGADRSSERERAVRCGAVRCVRGRSCRALWNWPSERGMNAQDRARARFLS